jgi:serine/threonine protein kinase
MITNQFTKKLGEGA